MIIQFDNDKTIRFGECNLFIKEIIIDKEIKIPYLHNSEFDIAKLDGKRRIRNIYSSSAELTRQRLINSGIDSSTIRAITNEEARINRTLSSVLAVRDFLDTTNYKIAGINILSAGIHSRRTWLTYKRLLDTPYPIGIISVSDTDTSYFSIRNNLRFLREMIALIYYWIILIPY